MKPLEWLTIEDQRSLLAAAYGEALESPDQSTQCGAGLFKLDHEGSYLFEDTLAHNRFPYGVRYLDERWERPLKYEYIEHAERNAIYKATRLGIPTEGMCMVAPWAACHDCARAIIQSGIDILLTHKQAFDRSPDRWKASLDSAYTMMDEAGVRVVWYDGPVFENRAVNPLLHTGELWIP